MFSLIQKNLLYSEKINQMSNLIETQKQILAKNEKKTDNLLKKLDELTMINNSKSVEISKLKYENSSLKDEVKKKNHCLCFIKISKIENLNNKVFLKNHEIICTNADKNQMELYKKGQK